MDIIVYINNTLKEKKTKEKSKSAQVTERSLVKKL